MILKASEAGYGSLRLCKIKLNKRSQNENKDNSLMELSTNGLVSMTLVMRSELDRRKLSFDLKNNRDQFIC